jgi:carbamoylphosphate synthase large subunit
MQRIGLDVPKSALVNNLKDGIEFAGKIGFPSSSVRRSRSAAPAAASPTTAKS